MVVVLLSYKIEKEKSRVMDGLGVEYQILLQMEAS